MAYLTPSGDPAPDHICRTLDIPNEVHFVAAVTGALLELTKPYNWEQASGGTLSPMQSVAMAETMLERFLEMTCDCIKDLAFDAATGKLTYTDGEDNSVTVFDAGDTFTTNNYYIITADEANADDAYCYAAWMLAERTADDLQDMLEIVDVLEDATLSSITEIFASLVDIVPLFGDIAEAVIRINDNMAEAAFDWVKENARDIQARELAAQIFYCGIKRAMENGGQSTIRQEIINEAGALLIEFGFAIVDDIWDIPDLWNVFEDAYNALDGELIGYGIVAWFLLTDFAMDALGADRPLEAIIAHATKHAAAHDDRDCATFECQPWCHEFDFTLGDELGWTIFPHSTGPPLGEWNTNKFSSIDQFLNGKYRRWLRLSYPTFEPQVITSVKLTYDYTACTICGAAPNLKIEFWLDTVITAIEIPLVEGSFKTTTINVSELCDSVRPNLIVGWRTVAPTNGGVNIHKIEICGEDSNPF